MSPRRVVYGRTAQRHPDKLRDYIADANASAVASDFVTSILDFCTAWRTSRPGGRHAMTSAPPGQPAGAAAPPAAPAAGCVPICQTNGGRVPLTDQSPTIRCL